MIKFLLTALCPVPENETPTQRRARLIRLLALVLTAVYGSAAVAIVYIYLPR